MSKLWIFGDSFATVKNFHYTDLDDSSMPNWVWMEQLGRNLPVTSAYFRGIPGVSNEWIMHEVKQHSKYFSPDDYLIIVSTHINRRWFIKYKPDCGNIYLNNFDKLVSKKEAKAVKLYKETFLDQHLTLSKLYQEQFMTWCYAVSQSTKTKLCLLPAFDETPWHTIVRNDSVVNCLTRIDENEFTNGKDSWFFELWNGMDKRLCHLSEDNHTILAQKIVKFYKYNQPIDLQSEFKRNIYNSKEDMINYRPKGV